MHKPPAPAPHPEGALQDGACKRSKGPIWTQAEEGHAQRQWQKMGVRVEVKRPPPRKNCSSRRERPNERRTATRQRATTRPRAHQRAATGRHGSPPPCALRENDPTTPTQSRMPRQTPHDLRAQEGARRPTQRRACKERRRRSSGGPSAHGRPGNQCQKIHEPHYQKQPAKKPTGSGAHHISQAPSQPQRGGSSGGRARGKPGRARCCTEEARAANAHGDARHRVQGAAAHRRPA